MSKKNKGIMEQWVEELGFQMPFKDKTEIGDIVLMLKENDDGQVGMVYARIMGFDRDESKRDEWWHVHFVFMEVPPIPRTIILQTSHFTGEEIFTMGGRKVFIKAVNFEVFTGDQDQDITALPLPPKPKKKSPANEDPPPDSKKPSLTLIK